MQIAITGASGFVGRRLAMRLRGAGHTVKPVSLRGEVPATELAGCAAVAHLAGEPLAQRWTAEAKRRIVDSRVEGTRKLVAAMREHRPNVLVSASAIGYYGSCGDRMLTEQSPAGTDFLSEIAVAWENAASEAESLGVRVVRLRIGLVLGQGGGALGKMLLPFKLGLGGPLGSGEQWMSWIHIDDLCAMISFAMRESTLRGVWNAVAPHPVTNHDFSRALGRALHRPAIVPVPAFALRLLLGEMSSVLLASQRVIPAAAMKAGFEFSYPEISAALIKIVEG